MEVFVVDFFGGSSPDGACPKVVVRGQNEDLQGQKKGFRVRQKTFRVRKKRKDLGAKKQMFRVKIIYLLKKKEKEKYKLLVSKRFTYTEPLKVRMLLAASSVACEVCRC